MFVYQATLNTLELKEGKDTKYVIGSKSERAYTSKLTQLYTAFLYKIKPSGYKIEIQINKSVIEQKYYTTKIVNAYIVYDVDDCPKFILTIACLMQLIW